jgi:L-2-hydroxyglutarate oxidase LhgO
MLQVLEEELPKGTIRYSSKIVSIEEDGDTKIIQLADGSVLRAKVLFLFPFWSLAYSRLKC